MYRDLLVNEPISKVLSIRKQIESSPSASGRVSFIDGLSLAVNSGCGAEIRSRINLGYINSASGNSDYVLFRFLLNPDYFDDSDFSLLCENINPVQAIKIIESFCFAISNSISNDFATKSLQLRAAVTTNPYRLFRLMAIVSEFKAEALVDGQFLGGIYDAPEFNKSGVDLVFSLDIPAVDKVAIVSNYVAAIHRHSGNNGGPGSFLEAVSRRLLRECVDRSMDITPASVTGESLKLSALLIVAINDLYSYVGSQAARINALRGATRLVYMHERGDVDIDSQIVRSVIEASRLSINELLIACDLVSNGKELDDLGFKALDRKPTPSQVEVAAIAAHYMCETDEDISRVKVSLARAFLQGNTPTALKLVDAKLIDTLVKGIDPQLLMSSLSKKARMQVLSKATNSEAYLPFLKASERPGYVLESFNL